MRAVSRETGAGMALSSRGMEGRLGQCAKMVCLSSAEDAEGGGYTRASEREEAKWYELMHFLYGLLQASAVPFCSSISCNTFMCGHLWARRSMQPRLLSFEGRKKFNLSRSRAASVQS